MVTAQEVDSQLKAIGANFRYWGRAEIKELQNILVPGEQIKGCLNGHYEGGFAVLCATNIRLLLIDKTIFHLTVEDIRYDMLAEVDYGSQFYSANVRIMTPSKTLDFKSYKPKLLRQMTFYMQQRVMEMRQHHVNYEQQMAGLSSVDQANQMYQPNQQVVSALMPVAENMTPSSTGQQDDAAQVGTITIPTLPLPRFRNPYTQTPLLMRRRVGGKFAPVSQPQQQ